MTGKVLIATLLFASPVALHAQSLFDTRGLGTPAEGFDARARALSVNGVGLMGLSTSMMNPAEQAGTVRRGVTASFQPWIGTADFQGEEDDISATRFPLVSIVYPTRIATFTLGYGSVLEQSYAVIAEGQEILGSDTIATQDVVQHVGGIGQLRFGASRYVTGRLAVGLSIGIYTGNLDRGFSRTYPDSTLEFRDFETHTRWNYSAPQASIGFKWDPVDDLRIGGTMTWSGKLKAEPSDSGPTLSYEYDMPLRFAVGASGRVARNLFAAVSGTWVSWGSGDYRTPGNLEATVAEQQMEIGAGLEYTELRTGNRVFPIRLGARTSKLPFHHVGEEAPTEWAITGGIGFRLVEDEFGPLAVADVGVERATREGLGSSAAPDGLTEKFWRFTVSLSLFGR